MATATTAHNAPQMRALKVHMTPVFGGLDRAGCYGDAHVSLFTLIEAAVAIAEQLWQVANIVSSHLRIAMEISYFHYNDMNDWCMLKRRS
jgi:hypothetical protein